MVLDKILRFGEGRRVKKLWKEVEQIGSLEDGVKALTDAELRAKTDEFKARLADGETLDAIGYEAFAVVRETAWRVLGQRPFDVQLLGGLVIHQGDIAEMRTGEGKTLTSTMPVYLNALSGKGVHVVTVNPYLASRDAEWMGQVYRFLGLSVGYVYGQQPKADKRAAYAADVTYGTNNELGFDYLRDHMVLSPGDKVQRGHNFVIVDEIDSILIDEARTPLIISGPADASSQWYQVFARKIAPRLKRDEHYEVDEGKRTVAVTEEGVARVEELLGVDNLYENANTPLIHHLQNSLRAKELFLLDREYVIEGGEVLIVDENTGRTLPGRRYSEGLHQAIEAKEGVQVKEENQTLATITLQNYFRVYDKLAGMTGTAKTEEGEFAEIYGVGVVVVPTNKPIARADQGDLIYKKRSSKLDAVIDDIAERQQRGQPVLVGTISVEKSEELSKGLTLAGIDHEVLNAKQHFREAAIIAQAGQPGAVTVATNMAGRGVDIMLGGNPEELARRDAKRIVGSEPVPDEEGNIDEEAWRKEYERVFEERFAEHKAICKEQQQQVLELGGLYVLGTERHESRRIDNQLRGRSGRQGDPGESRFYLSLEDDLMRRFNASAVESIMTRLKVPEDVPIEAKMVTNAVARAQRQVEARNFEIRKNVLKYDDVMNSQRKVIYAERNIVLEGSPEQVEGIAEDFIEDAIKHMVGEHCPNGVYPEEWDLDGLKDRVSKLFDVDIDLEAIGADGRDANPVLVEWLTDKAMEAYEEREKEVGPEAMREVERRVILSIVDRVWREHLYEMDHLRDGIGLRAVGQRDPLVEYQREAYQAFVDMQARIKEDSARYLFNLQVRRDGDGQGAGRGDGKARPKISRPPLADEANRPSAAQFSYVSSTGMQSVGASYAVGGAATTTADAAPAPAGTRPRTGSGQAAANATATKQRTVVKTDKVGRNDPCPCGSGLKYKKCHGA